MMIRPWQIWLAFSLCAILALAAMGWLTLKTIEIDHALTAARGESELEQEISLALWRMDTKLAPLIAEEVARPPGFFLTQPKSADDPFSSEQQAAQTINETIHPKNVYLNFDVTEKGVWISPQANRGTQPLIPNMLEDLSQNVSFEELIKQIPETSLPAVDQSEQQVEQPYFAANSPPFDPQQKAKPQKKSGNNYLQERNLRYQDFAQQELRKQRASVQSQSTAGGYTSPAETLGYYGLPLDPTFREGISRPIWIRNNLLLARRVVRGDTLAVQGSWLDWENIKKELLEEVSDSMPDADLVPVHDSDSAPQNRMLAGLPVRLVVGTQSSLSSTSPPIRWALRVGWGAMLLAIGAVGLLLWGVVALSERRAAFVSSVTHELRTPLTTFRMYADMLARGMVPDAQRRQEYLETLQTESERLTHLVENVLSYARLERSRGLRSCEEISVGDLIERIRPRITERACQGEMELMLDIPDSLAQRKLTTDVSMVEQILFNLVDNAAKYAASASNRQIHCDFSRVSNSLQITVRDHGPGFDKTRAANRTRPFSKTSEQAAVTAPGVGLGLALCSRLAKQLGGKLTISGDNNGALVTLALPLS